MDEKTNSRTLTERVDLIEKFFADLGMTIDGEFTVSRCDKEDSILGAHIGRREPQQEFNRRQSQRIHEEQACDQTKPTTALEEITLRIGSSMSNIHRLTQRLEVVGNRTMGVLPEQGTDSALNRDKPREPDGTLDAVFRMLDYLDNTIESLNQKALRLERL